MFCLPTSYCRFQLYLCLATRNDSMRIISKVSVEGYMKLAGRPEWCPLKELPEKLEVSARDTEMTLKCEATTNATSFKVGWNKCIDEVTGGSTDD